MSLQCNKSVNQEKEHEDLDTGKLKQIKFENNCSRIQLAEENPRTAV